MIQHYHLTELLLEIIEEKSTEFMHKNTKFSRGNDL
jgi:hypothetical protein